ncbi:Phosphoserine phosphatase RsbU [Rosistilla carotiformis]|uniref:Phosphoserine phosphatase RsbU n=1 Tax=Rosistilla carotiformis TaxID=2528017 RepID=A0A518JY44_9BACT|nr:SpoIIE family protein phosphatase [Rosistilla carotiformis]QDV70463.1 Phosphoserine phosphatase RsbU [Rosistilla carotiformis]
MAFLSTISGPSKGARHEIPPGEIIIGRHPECKVVVEVGAVSRHHAKIVRSDDSIQLEDLKSRNGTFVNGQLISGLHTLREGDQIRICEVEFSFHTGEQPGFMGPESTAGLLKDPAGSGFGVVLVDDDADDSELDSSSGHVEVQKDSSGVVRLDAGTDAKLRALLDISRSLGGQLVLDEVLPATLESLFRIFPQADRGFIVLETPEGKLVPRWAQNRNKGEEGTVRISRTIIRQVMNEGTPMISLDAASDERFEMSESIADFRIRSMICAPLIDSDGKAFGALQIDTMDQKNRFNAIDIDLLSSVATQAGVAIHNAKLHENALQQQSVEQDLRLANDVQHAFLPMSPPDVEGYEFHSFYRAAHHIGGDYFDYVDLGEGRVGIIVADVVGHGVAAAMYMAKLSAETRFCLASEPDPATAIDKLNERMCALPVEQFVTFLLVVLDPKSHTMTIVNAGHMPPIVLSPNGELSEPGEEESGVPIAVMDGFEYERITLPIQPGELAVMYTDGINEAMDINDDEFGMERVRAAVLAGGKPEQIGERILSEISKFAGNAPQFDDMCIVILGRNKA